MVDYRWLVVDHWIIDLFTKQNQDKSSNLKWNSNFHLSSTAFLWSFRLLSSASPPAAGPAVQTPVVSAVIPVIALGAEHPGAGTVVIDGAFQEAMHVDICGSHIYSGCWWLEHDFFFVIYSGITVDE